MNKQKQAFTLVELVVVITILAILGTIGFISYRGYIAGVRDTNRISQLGEISKGLETIKIKAKKLPFPEEKIDILAGAGNLIGYQGNAGKTILESIDYSTKGVDPKDGSYYSYYITKKRNKFQLMTFLEEDPKLSINTNLVFNNKVNAAIDYSLRFPAVIGAKLGIMIDENNTPIQNLGLPGSVDITALTENYISYISNEDKIIGTDLAEIAYNFSCKRYYELGARNNGNYKINPAGIGESSVYCNMTIDGGGWTFCANETETYNFTGTGTILYLNNKGDFDKKEFNTSVECIDSNFDNPPTGSNKKCYIKRLND